MPQAIIYDHDGTLVDSIAIVVEATNAVLRRRGLPERTRAEVMHGMVHPTAPRMGDHARIADPDEHVRLAEEFYAEALRVPVTHARVYDGVPDAVARFASAGVPQAVLSNNQGAVVRRLMTGLGLAQHFRVMYGEEDVPAPKPDPRGVLATARALGADPARCVYVGDGRTDVAAAHGAGMPIVGVTWGIHPREEMRGMGFDALVDRPEALAAAIGRVAG